MISSGVSEKAVFLTEMIGNVAKGGKGIDELSPEATEGLYILLCDILDGLDEWQGSVTCAELLGQADRSRGLSLSPEAVNGFHAILLEWKAKL